jgi:hypothetical protein
MPAMSGAYSATAARIRCINQGGRGAGQAPVRADGDPGRPVIRPACSGSVIQELVIQRVPERGLVPVPAVPWCLG